MPKERGDESLRALEIISKEKDEKTIARIEEIGAVAKAVETAEKTRRKREAIDKARELEREQAERMGLPKESAHISSLGHEKLPLGVELER
jgi:hypothetical protein